MIIRILRCTLNRSGKTKKGEKKTARVSIWQVSFWEQMKWLRWTQEVKGCVRALCFACSTNDSTSKICPVLNCLPQGYKIIRTAKSLVANFWPRGKWLILKNFKKQTNKTKKEKKLMLKPKLKWQMTGILKKPLLKNQSWNKTIIYLLLQTLWLVDVTTFSIFKISKLSFSFLEATWEK